MKWSVVILGLACANDVCSQDRPRVEDLTITRTSKKSSETTARPSKLSGSRPNIVFVPTDDQSTYSDGCHSNTDIRTPNMGKKQRKALKKTGAERRKRKGKSGTIKPAF